MDGRRTIHELTDTVGINFGVCQEILRENLNMRRIAVKFVPRLLTDDQKQRRVNVCLELREKLMRTQLLSLGSLRVRNVGFVFQIENETEGTTF
jgi:hypothetical protein